jgi:hypothetical protein
MPLGTKRIAFRNYDPKFKPWCYGCTDLTPTCCESQENPDYAYSLDDFERNH